MWSSSWSSENMVSFNVIVHLWSPWSSINHSMHLNMALEVVDFV